MAPTAPELSLTDSARAVLHHLIANGPTTRPVLSGLLKFSKPTMSAAVFELTSLGLVSPFGISQGATGRKATVYGLGPLAGHVIGIDAGSTQVRAVAQTLDGRILAEASEPLDQEQRHVSPRTGRAVAAVMKALTIAVGSERGQLRAISVAVPMIVSQNRPELTHPGDLEILRGAIEPADHVRVILENNVNCAAIAEMHHGAARGRSSFAYLQVGVKIGLGIVYEGKLFRGFNGAAGEVARSPFPWSPDAAPRNSALEDYLGSRSLMRRIQADWPQAEGAPPETARDLFGRAAQGSAAARRCVEAHAADIGRLVAGIVGLIDPGLVILGGGVGQNALLVDGVSRMAGDLAWPTEIAISALGNRGTVLGATQLAARAALDGLIGLGSPVRGAGAAPACQDGLIEALRRRR